MTLSVSRSWAWAWRACGEALIKATGLPGNSTLATNQSRGQRQADFLGTGHFGRPGKSHQFLSLCLPGARPDLQPERPLYLGHLIGCARAGSRSMPNGFTL